MFTVALIGPDGAGKSTITKMLPQVLPLPMKSIYMGVNLESSSLMLPSTRLLLAVRRARAGKAGPARAPDAIATARAPVGWVGRARRSSRSALRLANWVGEECLRLGVAWFHQRRGTVVVFDRHFFHDYYGHDIEGFDPEHPLSQRIHGFLLDRLYPKPDLTIVLDAPGEVLFERKREASPEWLEQRRQEYLELSNRLPRVAVVDATRPLAEVVREVADLISSFHRELKTNAAGRD